MSMTLIVALWRHRLSSPSPTVWRHSTDAVRIIVVAPRELLVDDRHVDYFFQVPSPQHHHDEDHSRLFAKVRELAITFGGTSRRLCCFERSLQCELAALRHELGIAGVTPVDYRLYSHRYESKAAARRGGLTTARYCTVGAIQSTKSISSWISKVELQIGRYPLTIKRSVSIDDNRNHRIAIVIDSHRDLQLWMVQRAGGDQSPNHQHEMILEECLRQGNEFWAMCTAAHGLIGTMSMLDRDTSGMHESCRAERVYSLEYFNADETRDVYPGIESFVAHILKALFARHSPAVVFVNGYYRAHNAIYFVGVSLQAPTFNDSFAQLFRLIEGYGWEWSVVDATIDDDASITPIHHSTVNAHHHHQLNTRHHVLVNFPLHAGAQLMHQSTLRHHNKRTEIRQLWCASEICDEESESDSQQHKVAANSAALQVFVSGSDRDEVLIDVRHIMSSVELAVDRCNVVTRTKNSSNGGSMLRRGHTTDI